MLALNGKCIAIRSVAGADELKKMRWPPLQVAAAYLRISKIRINYSLLHTHSVSYRQLLIEI